MDGRTHRHKAGRTDADYFIVPFIVSFKLAGDNEATMVSAQQLPTPRLHQQQKTIRPHDVILNILHVITS